jgi:omega-6 fatty acid desaturase (delta-12 desaturase)
MHSSVLDPQTAKEATGADAPADTRRWRKVFAAYQQPTLARSILELALSAAPLLALWSAGWVASAFGLWWLALAMSVPAAGFLLRLFMVQHDCGHHAFFKSAKTNDAVGRAIGVLTLTPYDCWRRTHAIHHATTGNLDRRSLGAIITLTVEEYSALTLWGRLRYRAYRNPLVLFGLGPAYVYLLQQRVPQGLMREGWRPWLSAMGTNAATALVLFGVAWLAGWQGLLLVLLPTVLLAASAGVWLFFVQHQFEGAYWRRHNHWDHTDAAIHGSSHYDLPRVLRWLTANIGVHHVHHASTKIPFYRLQKVLKDNPELRQVSRLGLRESLGCVKLALWDETAERLISFRDFSRSFA